MKIVQTLALLAVIAVPGAVSAADQPVSPKKQTEAGLYLTAREAAALKAERGDAVFFIDVRDPVEIMFTGSTDRVDASIPFKTADISGWNAKKSTFPMRDNPAFLDTVAATLEAKGLDRDDPILTMCRSGSRSAAAANALTKAGFTQVYSIVDGFEGDVDKAAEHGPVRSVNGWKNSGLPWTTTIDREKLRLPPVQ